MYEFPARDVHWVHLSLRCGSDPSKNPSRTHPPTSVLCGLSYMRLQFRLINCLLYIVCECHNSKYRMARSAGFCQGLFSCKRGPGGLKAIPTSFPHPLQPAQLGAGSIQFPRRPPQPRNHAKSPVTAQRKQFGKDGAAIYPSSPTEP